LAECPDPQLGSFLEEIAAHAALGGWTVIASALRSRFPLGMEKILQLARHFIVQADAWFACDCFGERVLGQALVNEFDTVLQILSSWRFDQNRWIRRSVGVAGHFWAKRARGALQQSARAVELMAFFKPLLNEPQIDAAKGTGWALKTLGRSYPQALFNFLNDSKSGNFSPVILRKALKFLPKEMRTAISH
jgi:3-methyladenine DNA glycosylase AlkD